MKTIEQLKKIAMDAVRHGKSAAHASQYPDDETTEVFKVDDGKNFFLVRVHRETLETSVEDW